MSATMSKPTAPDLKKAIEEIETRSEATYHVLKEAERGPLDARGQRILARHGGAIHTACRILGIDMACAAENRDILQRALDYLQYQPDATLGVHAAFQGVTKLLAAIDVPKTGPWIQGVGYWPFGPSECKAWEASEAFRRSRFPASLDPNADRLVAILGALREDRQGMRTVDTISHAARLVHRVLWGWEGNPGDPARYDRICRVITANDDILDAIDMVEAAKDSYSPHARMVWLHDIVNEKLAPALPPGPVFPAARL